MVLNPTSKFHHSCFLSYVRVILYAPSCTEYLPCCTRRSVYTAAADPARRQNGLVVPQGCRLVVSFIRHGITGHHHAGSLQAVHMDVPPAVARTDILGVHSDQGGDTQTQHTWP